MPQRSAAQRHRPTMRQRRFRSLKICRMQKSPSVARSFGDTHPVASNDTPNDRAQNRRVEICWKATAPEAPSNTFRPLTGEKNEIITVIPHCRCRRGLDAAVGWRCTRPARAACLQLEEVPLRARCGSAGQARYQHAQPDERPGIGTRLLLDQQSPANLQWLADGGQAL